MIGRRRFSAAPLSALMGAFVASLAGCATGVSSQPQVGHGRIERLPDFGSRFVDARHVDVWLPPGYSANRPCRVLYMHDGQALFDGAMSMSKKGWHVDAALGALIAQRAVPDTLVVGIWNTGLRRHSEYFPDKFLPFIAEPLRGLFISKALDGRPRADAYLRFIVEELKPAIDRRFATLPQREHSFVMGSSMGGLISMYALTEYPRVFGGAACLSTHWIGGFERNTEIPDAALRYLEQALPAPGAHRLYMDRGTLELDALYDTAQARVDALLRERGYAAPRFSSRVFEGTGHNEVFWRERLHIPLRFLLEA